MANQEKGAAMWEEEVQVPEWGKKQARRRGWGPTFTFWTSLVVSLVVLWFCYALYNMVVDITFSRPGKGDEMIRFGTTLIETHYSGLKVDKSGLSSATVSPWLTEEATLKLYKQIGQWEMVVGTVELKKPLGGDISYEIHYEPKQLDEQKGTFSFTVPPDLLGRPPFNQNKEQDALWEQLSHIEDGYVAEMAFSTRNGQTPTQLMESLKSYDLALLQMPVYAGEWKTFKTAASSSGEMMSVPHLSLRPVVFYANDEDDNKNQVSSYQRYMDDTASVTEAAQQLIPDLEWLTSHGKSGYEQYDSRRLDYLKKNGVIVYGAVVTGPVRELEKLRQNALFHDFKLGRIEVWNW